MVKRIPLDTRPSSTRPATATPARPAQRSGAPSRALTEPRIGTDARRRHDSRSGLGPRGMALFERLFGSAAAKKATSETLVRSAPTIAIASGKGGTGKSFLATSLAVAMHRNERRTTLVDCDFGLACAHLLLGVKPKTHLQHLLRRQAKLDQVACETPAGPRLVPGVTGLRQMAALADHELQAFGETLEQLSLDADLVLLDTGAGLTPQNVLTLCSADHVLLVTQPEIAALTDAYAVIKTLKQLVDSPNLSVVVNRVTEDGHGEATFDKLQSVAQRHAEIDLRYLGSVPEEPLVTQRRLGQLPLIATEPDSVLALAVRQIASRLEEVAGPFEPREIRSDQTIRARFEDYRRIL